MSRGPSAPVSSDQAGRTVSAAITRADLLDIERDRPKRIDRYIDYFGVGRSGEISRRVPAGEPDQQDRKWTDERTSE